jgi:hypothetical protein
VIGDLDVSPAFGHIEWLTARQTTCQWKVRQPRKRSNSRRSR